MRLDEPITELPLLLPIQQAVHLEQSAHARGLTVGQLIRLLLKKYLRKQALSRTGCLEEDTPDCVMEWRQAGQ